MVNFERHPKYLSGDILKPKENNLPRIKIMGMARCIGCYDVEIFGYLIVEENGINFTISNDKPLKYVSLDDVDKNYTKQIDIK